MREADNSCSNNRGAVKDLIKKLIDTETEKPKTFREKMIKKVMSKKEEFMSKKPPLFLHKDHRRDAKGRRPDDEGYDHTTLMITDKEYESLTDGLKRYFSIKKFNMDKVLFWRFGDWYIMHFEDLSVASKYLDLAFVTYPGVAQVGFEVSAL